MKESIIERNKRIGAEEKRAAFIAKQKLPYEIKKNYAAIRAREFVGLCDQHGKNYHVSVGGLDSITLFLFLHSIGIRCLVCRFPIWRTKEIRLFTVRSELFRLVL